MDRDQISQSERLRLHTLRSLDILDTPPEERFDRLTRIAQRLFQVPIALVTLLDENRQWFKSRQGLTIEETPLRISFCAHTINRFETFVVEDARKDPRFRDNPLVTCEPKIRFYAGQALRMPDGVVIGALCLIDRRPRRFKPEDLKYLYDLARIAENEFATLQLIAMDGLTGVANRRGFQMLAKQALAICNRLHRPASLLFFDIDALKAINDSRGHLEGDRALIEFAGALREICRESDLVGRLGGDEFVVLLSDTTPKDAEVLLSRLSKTLDGRNRERNRGYPLNYSAGHAKLEPGNGAATSIPALLRQADRLMYQQKHAKRGSDSSPFRRSRAGGDPAKEGT